MTVPRRLAGLMIAAYLAHGCTTNVEVCIPARVLPSVSAASAATWTIHHIAGTDGAEWTPGNIRFEEEPKAGGVSTLPTTKRDPERVFCTTLTKYLWTATRSVEILAKAPVTGQHYRFEATLEVPNVPESKKIRPFLADESMQPFCNWKGFALLTRKEGTLAKLTVWPAADKTSFDNQEWSACIDTDPKRK